MDNKHNNFVGGDIFRDRRLKSNLSAKDVCTELSKVTGRTYTPKSIYTVENGKLRPSRKLLMGLMTVLSITEDEARGISQDVIDILDCNNIHGNTKK